MSEKSRRLLPCLALLWWSLPLHAALLQAAEEKAAVLGTQTANLRAGAGAEYALKLTLKAGDQVTVEKLEGERYFVTAADGQQGYIHKSLLKVAGRGTAPTATPQAATTRTPDAESK